MKNFKNQIIEILDNILVEKNITEVKANELVDKSSNKFDSDYSIACFKLSKILKQNPIEIADELAKILSDEKYGFQKVESVSGYVNILINENEIIYEVLNRFKEKNRKFGELDSDEKKEVICIDYSSPNIAKPFHIGHLKTTVIGQCFKRLGTYLGDTVIGINHLGDYGTQFGKMIEGYNLWKSEYNFDENPIEALLDIYIRINNLCKEDENVLEKCRNNFKQLEDGDEEKVKIWEYFVEISMKEFNKIYDILGVSFDSIRGESAYSKDLPGVIKFLADKNILTDSEGAKIVEFDDDTPPCLIEKSNGSTLYITRDIATVLYRIKTYDYNQILYIVASEQILHFKQLKKIMEKAGIDKKYTDGIKHIPYGMIRLETGKMSTREGNVVKIEELLNESISRTNKILSEKENINLTDEEKQEIAKQVGVGAVIFWNLSNILIKDQVFKWENVLNFAGETSIYIQYVNVRIKSILRELGYTRKLIKTEKYNLLADVEDNFNEIIDINKIDIKYLKSKEAMKLIKKIYEFPDVLRETKRKYETYILTSYLIELAKTFTEYYNKEKILVENEIEKNTKIYLIYILSNILEIGLNILGIESPDKM